MRKLLILFTGALIFALALSSGAYAEDYLWLEAEDAEALGYVSEENSMASEGELMVVNNSMSIPEGGYSLTFDINIAETGDYDIWAVTNDVTSRNFSALEWAVGENSNKNGTKECNLYKHKLALLDQQIAWTKLASGIKLNAGTDELVLSISSKATSGPRSYMSAVDCVVIVPTATEYVPDESMQRPKEKPHTYAHIELENPDNQTFIGTVDTQNASGNKLLYAYDIASPDGSDNETLNYSFTLDNEGDYDLWYLGAEMNVMHLSGTKWSVDEQEITKISQEPHNGVIIMNTAGATSDLPIYWQKLGTETLSEGRHVLNINYTYRALQGAERRHVIWADCVIVVPKDWEFTPPADQNATDKLPKFEVARLDARYFAEEYMNDSYDMISEDIELPGVNVLTPGGSTIVAIGGEGCPVDEDGTVTRPYFDEGDQAFVLPVYAKKENSVSSYKIPASVKALGKYDVSDITVSGTVSDTVTASVDIKINTSPESEITGGAMLIAALYNKDGVLIGTSVSETDVTREVKTVEVSITNEENADEAYLKIYLLNNRNLLNKLCETKIVRQEENA